MKQIHVGIFYWADLVGQIPGGIDTVIRTILKYAPADIDYTLYGASSDLAARPIGQELSIQFGNRATRFIPLVGADPSGVRQRMPLTVRYMWELQRYIRSGRLRDVDIFDFHRIEPTALIRNDRRPKNIMIHQDMADILRNKQCDIGWRHAPWLYDRLERSLLRKMDHVFCVRQSAIDRYRTAMPTLADRFEFLPTWVDTELFHPSNDHGLRERIVSEHGLAKEAQILISIGRLDRQKDPLLLLEAIAILAPLFPKLHLLMVGDGNLRAQIEQQIGALELSRRITLLGARQPAEVAELLRASDLFVLSSAYEGMPIAVLEALASGIPVVTTKVGEVGRVVHDGVNGFQVPERTAPMLASAIGEALTRLQSFRGAPCQRAVLPYHPDRILSQIYENHRRQSLAAAK